MDRSPNKKVVEFRNKLRALYHEWNHMQKKGLEHLPMDCTPEDMDTIKETIEKESKLIQDIETLCHYFVEELDKERRKL